MRSRIGAVGTTLAAAALAASLVAPALAVAAATPPSLKLTLGTVVCNPGGVPGIRATVTGTILNPSGAVVRGAQLGAFEFRVIDDPAIFPFPISGSSVATWLDETAAATRSVTDTRTIDTTDPATWDRGNYSVGIWSGSRSDAWWGVAYTMWTTARGSASQGSGNWYVSCPTGRIVSGLSLAQITQADMPKP